MLGEASDLAVLFPVVRPRDTVFDAYADRAAEAIVGPAEIPVEVVEEGIALLDVAERSRIVESWALRYPDRWQAMLDDGGADVPVSRAVVAGAVRIAIAERAPPPRELLGAWEGGAFRVASWNALAFVIAPMAVWSMDEAMIAAATEPPTAHGSDERFARLEDWAGTCVGQEHLERTRAATERLARHLPFPGLPRASETLADGCDVVLADDVVCAPVACRLLCMYAMSPAVARERAAQRSRRPPF